MNRKHAASLIIRYTATFLIVTFFCFMLPRLTPGDPIMAILGDHYYMLPQDKLDELYYAYGLDKSLPEQYILYLKSIFTFNLGYSTTLGVPVTDLVKNAASVSAMLMIPALLIGAFTGLFTGILAGSKKGAHTDKIMTPVSIFIYSIPTFLIGIVFLTIFAFQLGWFPLGHLTSGSLSSDSGSIADIIYHLTLPIAVLSISVIAGYHLMIRNVTAQIRDEYYIKAKQAHGFSDAYIRDNVITKNVSTQFASIFAMSLGGFITGAMIIEVVFSLNGMGQLMYTAIMGNDYMLIQGVFVFVIIITLIANFAAEMIYGILDPRVADGVT